VIWPSTESTTGNSTCTSGSVRMGRGLHETMSARLHRAMLRLSERRPRG
jgi:hypothetical protein